MTRRDALGVDAKYRDGERGRREREKVKTILSCCQGQEEMYW